MRVSGIKLLKSIATVPSTANLVKVIEIEVSLFHFNNKHRLLL